jgi:hypothetical protein
MKAQTGEEEELGNLKENIKEEMLSLLPIEAAHLMRLCINE